MTGGSLIVGLGNPGKKYEKSRHNLGFMVIKAFAAKRGWDFKRGWRFKGYIAHGNFEGKHVHLLLPITYMNLSGKSVRKVLEYYKIPRDQSMIVVDDVHLDIGMMRIRSQGSSGGHNGLKSIEECLQTQEYPRTRIGVGRGTKDLKEHVLDDFNSKEQSVLPQVLEQVVTVLEGWLTQGLEFAMQLVGELNQQPIGI